MPGQAHQVAVGEAFDIPHVDERVEHFGRDGRPTVVPGQVVDVQRHGHAEEASATSFVASAQRG